ncbi:MAG: PIN domain-containing protein [Thermomicrobiales bacterium]
MSDHDSQHTESRVSGATVPVAFVDASAIVALVDRNEETHAAAVAAYNDLVAGDYRLFTTNHVVAETLELLSATVGAEIARQWLRDLRLPIYHVTEPDEQRALALVVNSRNPQGLSWADATSLVVMERFGISDAFAVDPGFLSEQS